VIKHVGCGTQQTLAAMLRSASGHSNPAWDFIADEWRNIPVWSVCVPLPSLLSLISEHAHKMSEWRHILQQSRQEICRPGSGEVYPDWLWPSCCWYIQVRKNSNCWCCKILTNSCFLFPVIKMCSCPSSSHCYKCQFSLLLHPSPHQLPYFAVLLSYSINCLSANTDSSWKQLSTSIT